MVLVAGVVTDVFFQLKASAAPAGFFVRFHTRSRPSTPSKKLISPTSHLADISFTVFHAVFHVLSLFLHSRSLCSLQLARGGEPKIARASGMGKKKLRGWKGGFFAFKMKLRNGGMV